MTIEAFAQNLANEIRVEHTDLLVDAHEVVRTNGTTWQGIIIRKAGDVVTPTVYADGYYSAYERGEESISEIAQEIFDKYEESKAKDTDFYETVTDWEKAREKVVFRLLNKAANKGMLEGCPHREVMGDLVVFYALVAQVNGKIGTSVINNDMMESLGVTEEDLYHAAMESAPEIMPADINSIGDVVGAMLTGCNPDAPDNLYVVTNKERMYGAGTILYPGMLKSLAERFGGDLIILPSSVHEVLVIPDSHDHDPEEFSMMVREVNASCVADDELLSDHVYKYCRATGEISG